MKNAALHADATDTVVRSNETMRFCAPAAGTVEAFAAARAMGFEGVEVIVGSESPARLAQVARETTMRIACVACDATYTGAKDDADDLAAAHIRAAIDLAGACGASVVRLPDARTPGTVPVSTLVVRFGDWLAPLVDHAGGAGVKLAVQNGTSFRTASDLWKLVDRLARPSLGVCYDVLDATLAHESPAVGVSVLNSRLAMVRVRDANLSSRPIASVPLGDGDVPVEALIKRLRGIGYTGWVSLVAPTGDDARTSLEHLHRWRTRLTVSERELPFQKKPAAKAPVKS